MSEETEAEVEVEVLVQPLIVDVYAYLEDEDVLFSHAWRRRGAPRRKQGRLEIPKGERDAPIHFLLHDRTKLDLTFKSPECEAIWVDLDQCPTGAGNGGQITFESVARNLLRVTDANAGGACTLHFALRFDGIPIGVGPPYEYDPEIRNGGSF